MLRRSFAEETPDVFLESLRQTVLPEPLAASRFPGAYRLANVDRFLAELEQALLEGETGEAILRRLRRAEREKPDDTSGRPRTDADGVRVLTIHGAKGLGFEHVYLVQTHAVSGRGGQTAPTAVHQDGQLWEMTLLGRRTPGFFAHECSKKQIEEAEKIRLLYVALTRAKKRLVTVGCVPVKGSLQELFQKRVNTWANLSDLWQDGSLGPREDRYHARWVWLGHPRWETETPRIRGAGTAERGIDPVRVTSDGDSLQRRIEGALEWQARSWLGTASEEAHRLFREALAEGLGGVEEEAESLFGCGADRRVAMAVGTAMHSLLERFDLGVSDLEEEWRTRLEEGFEWLSRAFSADDQVEVARMRLEGVAGRFREGPSWQRFLDLEGSILARELPAVARPAPGGAVGAISGTIDLVYRDPITGEVVVADFKSDRVESAAELEAKLDIYRPQIEIYASILRDALKLPTLPRRELWFLWSGAILTVE